MISSLARLSVVCAILLAAGYANAAVYPVTKTADTNDSMCDADCSLREAIAAANATVDNDIIVFALPLFSSPQTITLGGTELVIANNGSLTILGTGANRLTISGNNASRILVSGANVVVNIHNLRFTAGNGVGVTNSGRGGAIYNVGGTMLLANSILTGNAAANGGALNNAASAAPAVPANLTIVNCIISSNSSTSSGSAMQNFSTSTLHLRNSTVNNNSTTSTGIAGAIQANGTVTITNSTFSGNTAAAGTGGGVYYNGSSLTVTNSTLAFNSSSVGGGGFHRTGTTATAMFRNSIISDNAGAAATLDAFGLVTSQGNNIVENVGTSTGWVASDLQNMDPILAPLGFYGGFGMTHLPLLGSVAINAGQNCVLDLTCPAANPPVAISTDERGAPRPFGANVDIGALEVNGDYYAVLPSAERQIHYTFTLVPVTNSFVYTVNSGGFGGMTLVSDTSATVIGNSAPPGVYDALVHINRVGVGQTFHNFRINVLADLNALSITGHVLTNSGEPVSKAYVTLTGFNGQTYTTVTNAFGYFRFDGLPPGLTGTLTVENKKGLTFDPQVIVVADVIEGLNLRALP